MSLTERSERTFWRMFSNGRLSREIENGKAMVDLDSLGSFLSIPLDVEGMAIVMEADRGGAAAQTDLAIILLSENKLKGALYWLEQAVKQGYPDAMSLLGRCHIDGTGVPKNHSLGLMWLSKAAASGHVISKAQIDGLCSNFRTPTGDVYSSR